MFFNSSCTARYWNRAVTSSLSDWVSDHFYNLSLLSYEHMGTALGITCYWGGGQHLILVYKALMEAIVSKQMTLFSWCLTQEGVFKCWLGKMASDTVRSHSSSRLLSPALPHTCLSSLNDLNQHSRRVDMGEPSWCNNSSEVTQNGMSQQGAKFKNDLISLLDKCRLIQGNYNCIIIYQYRQLNLKIAWFHNYSKFFRLYRR